MINFRYHLVSLIAVFLALALGVVMGSTVIDRAIVDSLRSRIDKVQHNAELRKDQNDQLKSTVDQLNDYIAKTAGFAVTERLRSVPVTVFAVRGVDSDAISSAVQLAQQAGARVPGIVWLEPKLQLTKADDVKALAGVLGLDSKNVKTLRAATWQALALPFGALETSVSAPVTNNPATSAAGSDTGTTTTLTAPPIDEPSAKALLTKLGERGFVSFEGVGDAGKDVALADLPRAGGRVLLASGAGAKVTDNALLVDLARTFSNQNVETAAAEVFADSGKADRGTLVQPIVADDALGKKVSTVDNLEMRRGQVVAVLALADLGRKVVGHYGIGGEASLSVPEWWRP
ncbi:MAG: hypothetical protein JWL73_2337 [Actinomycetia bacterium]|nr:hypothetical protein [Actinomycetes bacterium]